MKRRVVRVKSKSAPTRMRVLAIDTGLCHMGWAQWHDVAMGELKPPDRCGVISESGAKAPEWWDRATRVMFEYVTTGFMVSLPERQCVQIAEMPEFRAGSAVGHAAAASDSLGMLYFMCGCYHRLAVSADIKSEFVTPGEWKGQLPKEVVAKRIAVAIGTEAADGTPIESHAWDAVGIGLWRLGHRLDDNKTFGSKGAR